MQTTRVNLISGPRNISTALMYSFANRPDAFVVDEPMYAYYLNQTDADHPGKEEILHSLPQELETVKKRLIFQSIDKDVYFIKGMAHHYLGQDWSYIKKLKNVFLIRDPKRLIKSFSKVIPNPTLQDIGLKIEWQLLRFLEDSKAKYCVLDAQEVLKNPKGVLQALCEQLEIPFYEQMLFWQKGPRREDGIWAKYWYSRVHESTCFGGPEKEDSADLDGHLKALYEESMPYYESIQKCAIRA